MRSYILLSLIPMILLGCSITEGPSDKLSNSTIPNPSGTKMNYMEEINKASSRIKNTPEFSSCMRPSVNMCLNQVGSQIARAQKSESFCDEIEDAGSREGCKYGVVTLKVSESKDINLCNALTEPYKMQCRSSFIATQAVEKKDIKICDTLSDGNSTRTGTSQILPSSTSTMQADQCKMSILQTKTNITETDCTVIVEKSIKDMCLLVVKSQSLNSVGGKAINSNTNKNKIK